MPVLAVYYGLKLSSKSEVVYLAPGTHTIDVVVRTSKRAIFGAGELRVELVELQSDTNFNLPMLN